MSDTNETIADILRKMRTYFQTQKRNGNPEHRPWHQVLSDWADLIEAAARRERVEREFAHKKVEEALSDEIAIRDEKIKQAAPGNVAVMRCWLKTIRNMSEHNDNDLGNTVVRGLLDQLTRIHTCAREALSAPARNCDRYGDEDDAFAAWHDALNDGDVVSVRNAFRWLFANAEGGDHA